MVRDHGAGYQVGDTAGRSVVGKGKEYIELLDAFGDT